MNELLIAIDHGNKNIKTVSHVFPACFVESGHLPAIGSDTLVYNGKEYVLTNGRKAQKDDKAIDEDYFVLTLFAIGKELASSGGGFAKNSMVDVTLLAGLPPLHVKELGRRFAEYLKRPDSINFSFNSLPMSVMIKNVYIYPQAYAAALTALEHFKDAKTVSLIDCGGYTVDILQLTDLRPDMNICTSLYFGTNTLFQRINERVRAAGRKNIPDMVIEDILLEPEPDASPERIELVQSQTAEFAKTMLHEAAQAGLDLQENRTVFVGGGSILLKKYIQESGLVAKPIFVNNVHANAAGYNIIYNNRKR